MNKLLNVNEIFASVNGEVNRWHQGSPAVFVRLQGCNLDCPYCDTPEAKSPNADTLLMTRHALCDKIEKYNIRRVVITGGEPLLQPQVFDLIEMLLLTGYEVSVETNGSMPIRLMHGINFCWVVDYKLHGQQDKMLMQNFHLLGGNDWVKIVMDEDDGQYIQATNTKHYLQADLCRANFAFGITNGNYEWLAYKLIHGGDMDVVLNTQLHKLIWPKGDEGSKNKS